MNIRTHFMLGILRKHMGVAHDLICVSGIHPDDRPAIALVDLDIVELMIAIDKLMLREITK